MKVITLFSGLLLLATSLPLQAQYPTVPDSVKQRIARENAYNEKLSEAAWKKALKVVKKKRRNTDVSTDPGPQNLKTCPNAAYRHFPEPKAAEPLPPAGGAAKS